MSPSHRSLRFDIFHQTSKTWWLGFNHLNFVFCFSAACYVHDRVHLILIRRHGFEFCFLSHQTSNNVFGFSIISTFLSSFDLYQLVFVFYYFYDSDFSFFFRLAKRVRMLLHAIRFGNLWCCGLLRRMQFSHLLFLLLLGEFLYFLFSNSFL